MCQALLAQMALPAFSPDQSGLVGLVFMEGGEEAAAWVVLVAQQVQPQLDLTQVEGARLLLA
jgi:hypothetical protein